MVSVDMIICLQLMHAARAATSRHRCAGESRLVAEFLDGGLESMEYHADMIWTPRPPFESMKVNSSAL